MQSALQREGPVACRGTRALTRIGGEQGPRGGYPYPPYQRAAGPSRFLARSGHTGGALWFRETDFDLGEQTI